MSDEYPLPNEPSTKGMLRGIVCTTPWKETKAQRDLADDLSRWFDCPVVRRNDRSILAVCTDEGVETVVVADGVPKVYRKSTPDAPIFFHPGMAFLRIQGMLRGETDRLVRAAGIEPGMTVLDATLGGGTDTLTLAHAVGDGGLVIACEVEPVLFNLFRYAKAHGFAPYSELACLAERIELVGMHHLDWLRGMPDDSADVVYFDPMFRTESLGRSAGMDALRMFTHPDPLSMEAVSEAKRVARQSVIVKERPMSREFRRLGLTVDKPRAKLAYGVWWKGEAVDC